MAVRFLFAVFAAVIPASSVLAAEYPARPIRFIVPFTAGSATDILARLVGIKLADAWGWFGSE